MREDWDLPAAFRAIRGAVPWGEWDGRFPDMEVALRLLLEATRDDLHWYDEELEEAVEARWGDEFSVPLEVVAALKPGHKLAYLGRLIITLALSYGVSLDAHRRRPGQPPWRQVVTRWSSPRFVRRVLVVGAGRRLSGEFAAGELGLQGPEDRLETVLEHYVGDDRDASSRRLEIADVSVRIERFQSRPIPELEHLEPGRHPGRHATAETDLADTPVPHQPCVFGSTTGLEMGPPGLEPGTNRL